MLPKAFWSTDDGLTFILAFSNKRLDDVDQSFSGNPIRSQVFLMDGWIDGLAANLKLEAEMQLRFQSIEIKRETILIGWN